MSDETGVSRRQFLIGAGAAGAGGLVAAGVAGGLIGRNTASTSSTGGTSGGTTTPYLIGSPYPTTGPYAADAVEMPNRTQLAIAASNAAGGTAGPTITWTVC